MKEPAERSKKGLVTQVPAAAPPVALSHFANLLVFETDCLDVSNAIASGDNDFLLIDVRNAREYAEAHIPTAVNIPMESIATYGFVDLAPAKLCVVYCDGPQSNRSVRAAIAIALRGRTVKRMNGGITGWRAAGFRVIGKTKNA